MYEVDRDVDRHLGPAPSRAVRHAMKRFDASLAIYQHPLWKQAEGYGLAAYQTFGGTGSLRAASRAFTRWAIRRQVP